jgi:glycosyltransferase involved in cell wall biosynthesis
MISIVTGTLNRLELLSHVINNTVGNSEQVELVLVDGGSTDGTIEYLKLLNHPRIKLIEVGGRSFYPHYMNLGIKNATHELIAQWNDDVLLCNDWDDVIKEIDGSDYYLFPWLRGSLETFLTDRESLFTKDYLLFDGCMNFGLYKKDVFRKIGMYDSQYQYYWCDSDMTERSMRFNLSRKECRELRVMEINSVNGIGIEKRTNPDEENYGFRILNENKKLYWNKTIPSTVEYL